MCFEIYGTFQAYFHFIRNVVCYLDVAVSVSRIDLLSNVIRDENPTGMGEKVELAVLQVA
jgi:hypothetical protein